ncbi:hypothetical protein NBJODN_NBJODN_04060, partial [Dysosmobacter welbionis]
PGGAAGVQGGPADQGIRHRHRHLRLRQRRPGAA